jgi:PiT family inorganic phosphate transporter
MAVRAVHPMASTMFFDEAQFVSFALRTGHGGNDAQKTMGIITVLLYSQGYLGGTFTCHSGW